MALDASIFNQLGRGVKSVADYDQEAQASQLNALNIAQGRMKQDEYTRGLQEQDALRQATQQFGADPTANVNALQRGGLFKPAMALQEHYGKVAKDKAAADKDALDITSKKRDTAIMDIASLESPEHARASIMAHYQNGDIDEQKAQMLIAGLPQNPADMPKWQIGMVRGIMAAKDRVADVRHVEDKAEQQRQFGITSKETARGHDLTAATAMRGQNMVDARSRESTAASVTKPFEVTGPDGAPVLVQQDKQGNISPVQGFQPKGMGATKLTEAQGNATNFAARMKDATTTIEAMEAKGVSSSDLRTKAAGSEWTNFLASPEGQQYRQAQENWVTANLRKESGAAIGKDEMAKDIAKWFPKIGDGKDVREQKAQARRVAEEGMLVQAGPGAKQVPGILDRGKAAPAGGFDDADKEARYQAWKAKQK